MHAGYLRPQTHLECAVRITFPLQRLQESASVLRYTYVACLVK
jgi:hypothetical protein